MSEHFPKRCESATAWCARCGRQTEHQVDSGRVGLCLDPKHPVPPDRKTGQQKPKPEQGKLF
jgi:hypothetical protein